MSRQVKLAGKPASAADTARALGVPPSRLDKLKDLALRILPKSMRKTRANGAKLAASPPGVKLHSKSRTKKGSRNAPKKNRAATTS
jgi:hypothetical protein